MSDAAAHATITLAQTKRLFESTATAVATGTGAGATGGHLDLEVPPGLSGRSVTLRSPPPSVGTPPAG